MRPSQTRLSIALCALSCLAGCDSPRATDDASARDASGPDARSADAALPDAPGLDAPTSAIDAAVDGGAVPDAPGQDDAFLSDAAPRCPAREALGLFVWSDDFDVRRDEILTLAEDAGVTEIYLHANRVYAGDLDEAVLADWIAAADARCLSVELLFGNASWIPTAGHAEAIARASWTIRFAAAHPDARPAGVHFDLEPQQLALWDTGDRPMLISQLVDVLEAMTPDVEAAGLRLSVDIGFFLDGYDVTRGGRARPGHEWVTDAVSRVVVMDYRDTADNVGHGGMIDLAAEEVAYASGAGVPIVLAAETTAQDPPYITFHEEGRAALFAQLAAVRSHYGSQLEGFAIHDEDGLATLAP
ncbi:MAG: hypothetical protein K1X94_26595 [Sandaracinaceae bacterium]|nr:hypothetical protein [Sandaracinaceae bacterium]